MLSPTGYLEAYLRESIQTSEFAEYLENAEIRCATEYDGSDLYKWICLLVQYAFIMNYITRLNLQRHAGSYWDKDGSFFIKLETDGLPAHDGPFINAINVDK